MRHPDAFMPMKRMTPDRGLSDILRYSQIEHCVQSAVRCRESLQQGKEQRKSASKARIGPLSIGFFSTPFYSPFINSFCCDAPSHWSLNLPNQTLHLLPADPCLLTEDETAHRELRLALQTTNSRQDCESASAQRGGTTNHSLRAPSSDQPCI